MQYRLFIKQISDFINHDDRFKDFKILNSDQPGELSIGWIVTNRLPVVVFRRHEDLSGWNNNCVDIRFSQSGKVNLVIYPEHQEMLLKPSFLLWWLQVISSSNRIVTKMTHEGMCELTTTDHYTFGSIKRVEGYLKKLNIFESYSLTKSKDGEQLTICKDGGYLEVRFKEYQDRINHIALDFKQIGTYFYYNGFPFMGIDSMYIIGVDRVFSYLSLLFSSDPSGLNPDLSDGFDFDTLREIVMNDEFNFDISPLPLSGYIDMYHKYVRDHQLRS